MTDARRAAFSGETFNWPVITQGLLACLCLVGFSSMPNSSWLVYPAIAVLAYTISAGAPIRRIFSSFDFRRALSRWCPMLLSTVAGIRVAALLADGPGVLAAVGSMLFILMLLVAGFFVATLLFRAGCSAAAWTGGLSVTAYQHLRLQARLVWLSVID